MHHYSIRATIACRETMSCDPSFERTDRDDDRSLARIPQIALMDIAVVHVFDFLLLTLLLVLVDGDCGGRHKLRPC